MNNLCPACNDLYEDVPLLYTREMMMGTKEVFAYRECKACGTLQLDNAPENTVAYYTTNYYSTTRFNERLFQPRWKAFLKSYRDYFSITGRGLPGRCIGLAMPNKATELQNFRHLQLKKWMKIMDVGCGAGKIPYIFRNAGFKNIVGIEPFIPQDIQYHNGLLIRKGFLSEQTEQDVDLIMFNHSFEHLSDPDAHLKAVHRMLRQGGKLLIRIPTVSSFAFENYREHWVQLDAPRHHLLYSIKGIECIAQRHNFTLERVISEGTAFQFIGSEQYKLGIPMYGDPRSWFEGNTSLFSKAQLTQFRLKAQALNTEGRGDAISVTFRKE